MTLKLNTSYVYNDGMGIPILSFKVIPSDNAKSQFQLKVKKPDEELWNSVESVKKPTTEDVLMIGSLIGNEQVMKFFNDIEEMMNDKKNYTDDSDGCLRYPLEVDFTAKGKPIYDQKQTLMHICEKMFKSSPENVVFNTIYFNMHDESGNVITYDMTDSDFIAQVGHRAGLIQAENIMPAKAVPDYSSVESNSKTIIELANQVCKTVNDIPVGVRFVSKDYTVYYDLNNKGCAKISADGIEIVPRVEGFIRYAEMKDITDVNYDATVTDLFKILGPRYPVGGLDLLKHVAWMISLTIRRIGDFKLYPMGNLWVGESQAGKTLGTKYTMEILDPGNNHVVSATAMSDPKNLMIVVNKGKMIILDNHGDEMSKEESDVLCNIFDGIPYSNRTLYTDKGETLLHANTMPMITSISEIKKMKADLDTRILRVTAVTPPQEKRMSTRRVQEYFNKYAADIRGGFLRGIQTVLKDYDEMCDTSDMAGVTPRMQNQVAIMCALANAIGVNPECVARAMTEETSNNEYVSANKNGLLNSIATYCEKHVGPNGYVCPTTDGTHQIFQPDRTILEWANEFNLKWGKDGEPVLAGSLHKTIVNKSRALEILGVTHEKEIDEIGVELIRFKYRKPKQYTINYIKKVNDDVMKASGQV
jgi:hypothetical protein